MYGVYIVKCVRSFRCSVNLSIVSHLAPRLCYMGELRFWFFSPFKPEIPPIKLIGYFGGHEKLRRMKMNKKQ